MLKMFLARREGGDAAHFWEDNWAQRVLGPAVEACELKPERPAIDRLLPREGLILEGGCGFGAWVAYYRRRGYRMLGLDFAQRALAALRGYDPTAPAVAGTVTDLPLADSCLDAYFSGGVVEHAESGPEAALAEAYRVLRPGGTLLISVPDFNPLRRLLYRRQSVALYDDGRAPAVGLLRTAEHTLAPSPWPQLRFFQYLYTEPEFRRLLEGAGFTVLESRGFGFRSTLMEAWPLRRAMERLEGTRFASQADLFDGGDRGTAGMGWGAREGGLRQLIWRFFVLEDERLRVGHLPLRLLQRLAANMRLYVCRRA